MAIFSYQANDLFNWLTSREDIVVLDVRNKKDFGRFQVESPYPFEMINVSYYDYMEIEAESVAKVPAGRKIRIVCAKEGSAKYVAEILEKHGYDDVGYLAGGIKTWGNMLVPKLVAGEDDFELYQFIRPGKASCSYGLMSGGEIMFFDPSRNVDFYLDFAKEKGCKVIKTFETHLQADYIAGMISGDMVFIASVGRPDLGGKAEDWAVLLYGSIQMVKKLNHNMIVLPGHYMDWQEANDDLIFISTLGEAIDRNNDIYYIESEAAFIQFIKDNMRQQPEEYGEIRQVNANLKQVEDDRAEELDLGKNECAATAYAKAQTEKKA
jgi:rhodanese-related sulfurtransferase